MKVISIAPLQVDRRCITNSRPIVKVTSLPKVIWEGPRRGSCARGWLA